MKPNFALDLGHDGINLLFRAKGGWRLVGSVALDDPNMSSSLEAMRAQAEALADGQLTSKLVIPNSQILYTTVNAPGPDDISREIQIRDALEGMTPYAVSELVFDWRAEGYVARVAVLARETKDEAEGFADQFGFSPVCFVARPEKGTFSGEPFFGKTNVAARVLGGSVQVTPDTTPVPANPKPMDGLAHTEDATPSQQVAPAVPESQAPEPAPAPLIAETSTPTPAPGPVPQDETAQVSPAQPASEPAPKPKPRAPKATARSTEQTPMLAPFPPTLDDVSSETTPKPIQPVQRLDETTSGAPRVAMPAAAPPVPKPTPSDVDPAESAPVSFSTRRSTDGSATPSTDDAAPSDAPKSRLTFGAKAQPKAPARPQTPRVEIEPRPENLAPTTRTSPNLVIDDTAAPAPRLAGDAEQRRQAMAKALGYGSDADSDEPHDAKGFSAAAASAAAGAGRLAQSLASKVSARREARAEAKAQAKAAEEEAAKAELAAALSSPAPVAEPEPIDAPDAKPERKRFGWKPKTKPQADDTPDPRAKEAEALTVFGARSNTSGKSGSRSMGLILTLVLVLLLAAVALWSTLFLDDEDTALFNPDPVTQPTTPTEPDPTPVEPETPVTPEPTLEPSSVLSEEEAQARYAATGVWQRAPDTLSDPESASADGVYVASIDPSVDPTDALALPNPGTTDTPPTATPVPPPPPGTTFDLDENGLVNATPEGAVSPTGVLVTRGRPAVVPPVRPEGLVPAETQDDAALAPEPVVPTLTPRERPGDLVETAQRARLGGQSLEELAALRPRERPDDLSTQVAEVDPDVETAADAVEDTQTAEATEEPAADVDLANATQLAVAASLRPSNRPRDINQIVARAQQAAQQAQTRQRDTSDASDGSRVIAASAATTRPSIPSTASVARTATMKNVLNLSRVNLIGVYGGSSSRRALVRMSNGRYVKVSVGDRLDGGRVTAISSTALSYQKGGRQLTLTVLPLG